MKKLAIALLLAIGVNSVFAQMKMNSKVRTVPPEITEAAFKKPKDGLSPLVNFLVGKSGDAGLRVRILHDWICDNIAYDTDMYFSGRISKQDYISVLKKKKAVCSGYTSLMNEMCRLAGIESIGISGWSKGFGYTGNIDHGVDHEWNAVKIGNTWRIIDVTWDAGYMERKTFIKKYSLDWYFANPEQFLYSHLPEKDEYQFVPKEKLKTKEAFVKEPYIAMKFFKYGLDVKEEKPDYTTIISAPSEFEFVIKNTSTAVTTALRTREERKDIPNASWFECKGNTIKTFFDVPDAGKYEANLFARNSQMENYGDTFPIGQFEQQILPQVEGLLQAKKITQKERDSFVNAFFKVEANGEYYLADDTLADVRNASIKKICKLVQLSPYISEPVLHFNIESDGQYEGFGNGVLKYPNNYASYSMARGIHIVSPQGGALKAGETYDFVIDSSVYKFFAVSIDNKLEVIPKNAETGFYELSVTVPEGIETFPVYASSSGKSYSGMWFYTVGE